MDMSHMSQTQNLTRMEDDMKMIQSEVVKHDNPMLASVNKSMLASKEPEMFQSNIANGSTLGISLKIPNIKK